MTFLKEEWTSVKGIIFSLRTEDENYHKLPFD